MTETLEPGAHVDGAERLIRARRGRGHRAAFLTVWAVVVRRSSRRERRSHKDPDGRRDQPREGRLHDRGGEIKQLLCNETHAAEAED